MNDEETMPYWSCALCGCPVAPFADAVWLSDVAVLCPKCGKKHRESQEALPPAERRKDGKQD